MDSCLLIQLENLFTVTKSHNLKHLRIIDNTTKPIIYVSTGTTGSSVVDPALIEAEPNGSSGNDSLVVIAGSVVGSIVFILLVIIVVVIILYFRKNKRKTIKPPDFEKLRYGQIVPVNISSGQLSHLKSLHEVN